MDFNKMTSERFHQLQNEFIRFQKVSKQWKKNIFTDQDFQEEFQNACVIYISNLNDPEKVIPTEENQALAYIYGIARLNLLKRIKAQKKNKLIPFDSNSLKSVLQTTSSDEKLHKEYCERKAKQAFEMLSSKKQEILSGIIIHNLSYRELILSSDNIDYLFIDGKLNEAKLLKLNNQRRQEMKRALKELRQIYYSLIGKDKKAGV